MSTSILRQGGKFVRRPNVLASELNLESPRMLTLDKTFFNGGANDVVLWPGTIICQLASGLGRAYAAGKSVTAVPTTAKVLTFPNVTIFKVGDVLIKASDSSAVGTIQSIDPVTDTVTLAANTATAIAIGDNIIGNAATQGTVYGMVVEEVDVTVNSNDVACYTAASVYAARLPYWDTAIAGKLPKITLVDPVTV